VARVRRADPGRIPSLTTGDGRNFHPEVWARAEGTHTRRSATPPAQDLVARDMSHPNARSVQAFSGRSAPEPGIVCCE